MKIRIAIPSLLLCAASFAHAQLPEFEVASIKIWTSREIGGAHPYPGGRVVFRGCTLQFLIQRAFEIQPFQISGGPAWMTTDRYDIDAKAPESAKSSQLTPTSSKADLIPEQRQMLQSLLADRFQLKYHRETREGQVYKLVKGNRALKLEDSKDKTAYPWAGGLGGGMIMGDGLAGINESMTDLAWRLSPYLGRPVLDQTGIEGSFDFHIEYRSGDQPPDVISMILTTIQELGLKLEASRGPVKTIVIDGATKPSAN